MAALVVVETRRTGLQNFKNLAGGQLLRIDDIFAQYADTGGQSVAYLAKLPVVTGALGKVANTFMDKKEVTENRYEMYSEYERRIYDEFTKMQISHPYYGLIFVGFSDGTIIEANEPNKPNDTFGPGYDPRKRPWYTQALERQSDINISLPYVSSSGDVVSSVTHKVYNASHNVIGVLAIDFNLTGLTNYLARLTIGRTGRVVVLSPDGLILSNPTNPETVFKNVSEVSDRAFFERVLSLGDFSSFEHTIGIRTYEVLTHINPSFGWYVAVLIDKEEVLAESVEARNKIIMLGLGLGFLLLVVVFFLSRSMTRPITLLVEASGRIADGDFAPLPDSSGFSGEMLELHSSLNQMTTKLSALIEDARAKTQEAEQQSQLLNTIALDVAEKSSKASESAGETTQKAEQGANTVYSLKNAIGEVERRTEILKRAINDLGEYAQGINQIMTVITGIADQTNLLALNAAVEAARSGEAGRGFAIVADEVRNLAEKTMASSKEVGASVESIRKGTEESVAGMEEAALSVLESTKLANTAQEVLKEIVSLSQGTAEQVRAIAKAAEDEVALSKEISKSDRGSRGIRRLT
jgi:methyl-accepting chemotaxis protein